MQRVCWSETNRWSGTSRPATTSCGCWAAWCRWVGGWMGGWVGAVCEVCGGECRSKTALHRALGGLVQARVLGARRTWLEQWVAAASQPHMHPTPPLNRHSCCAEGASE